LVTNRLYYGDNLEVLRDELALHPLISPVKKASRVETRVSHQKDAQGALL
jgi:hypothetical protein